MFNLLTRLVIAFERIAEANEVSAEAQRDVAKANWANADVLAKREERDAIYSVIAAQNAKIVFELNKRALAKTGE